MANLIAENIYSQVDEEGQLYTLMSEIIDHKSNGLALSKDDGFYLDCYGKQQPRMTTHGWKLLVEWKDGNSSRVSLNDMKDSYPLETAEYSIMNKILTEPAFAWWVPHVLRKRNQKINKVKSKYWKCTHKYSIRLPHSVEEALRIDEETRTDYWRKAIEKEMKNVMPAFEFHNDDNMPVGYAKFQCHMVFYLELDTGLERQGFVLMAMKLIHLRNLHFQLWFQGTQ